MSHKNLVLKSVPLAFYHGIHTPTADDETASYTIPSLDAAYSLSQSQLTAAFRSLLSMEGTKVSIDDEGSNAGDYGISSSGSKAVIQTGGEMATLLFGDYYESTGTWYLQKDGDTSLYAVPEGKGDWFNYTSRHYLDRTLIPVFDRQHDSMTDRIREIRITRPDLEELLDIAATDETPAAYTSAYDIVSPLHVKTSYQVMVDEIDSLFALSCDDILGSSIFRLCGGRIRNGSALYDHDG